jgi:signal transduction histidine kinase
MATVRVDSQENTDQWAKTGVMVRNDMTQPNTSLGYAIMSITPQNGYAFQWDSDGNGELDAGASPVVVEVDGRQIREAIANVLDNARRHARSRIEVAVAEQDDAVVIGIADDGPGIPNADRELAFERFATLDGKGGSGLGLPVARSIARNHGGDLDYDGTAFRLLVPGPTSTAVPLTTPHR